MVLHCDALHTGSTNTSSQHRYFVSSYLSQPTHVIRTDFPDAEGPRDDLWNDAIGELVAEWEQREGERDAERGSARRVRQVFGRL